MEKITLGLFFGGRSTEHEVSVITALQAYENLDLEKYDVIPVYVSKDGDFYTNTKFLDLKNYKDIDSLLLSSTKVVFGKKENNAGLFKMGLISKFIPLDIVFPLFHGSFGENGSFQGLCEIYQIPYVGFGVLGSAVGMDKILQKYIYLCLGLNVGNFISISREEFERSPEQSLKKISAKLKFPMVVKPATLGSSIGINIAKDLDFLSFAIEVASTYTDKILIEELFENVVEVNCSALGFGEDVKASVCEMPMASCDLLSFEDKYQRGSKGSKKSGMASMSRVIPAPISPKLTKEIQDTTIKIFKALEGCGVARIDFFVNEKQGNLPAGRQEFWINEINTPPGSLSYYLWEKSGIKYKELLDKLIELAFKRCKDQQKTQFTFSPGLLSQMAIKGGIKR